MIASVTRLPEQAGITTRRTALLVNAVCGNGTRHVNLIKRRLLLANANGNFLMHLQNVNIVYGVSITLLNTIGFSEILMTNKREESREPNGLCATALIALTCGEQLF